MLNVLADFDARAKEIDEYFDFIKAVLSADTSLSFMTDTSLTTSVGVTSGLHKTLKANGFLLIYNLVESTMSNAVEAIIEHLKNKGISFDDLNSKFKVVILKNTRGHNPQSIEPLLSKIAHDLIQHTFKKEELFSGNLDARQIRETMKTYGIDKRHFVNGDCLLTIKDKRNALAHGTISFAECGKDYDIGDLIKFKDTAKAYLKGTINDIEHFLVNEGYRK